jgi:acyl carrier protein
MEQGGGPLNSFVNKSEKPMDRAHISTIVKKHILNAVEGLEEPDLDLQKTLADYGASSLDIVSIVSGTMRELKVKIPRTELKNIKSINGLIDMFVASSSMQ